MQDYARDNHKYFIFKFWSNLVTLAPKTIVNLENVKKSVLFIKAIMSNIINYDGEMFFEQFKMFFINKMTSGIVKK